MAAGAEAWEIFRMILGEGLKLSLTGFILGLLGALWLGQAVSSLQSPVCCSVLTQGSIDLYCGVVTADRGRRRGLLLPRATRTED
jgi:ABC-type antimicrobial peptide transport system permease subunit